MWNWWFRSHFLLVLSVLLASPGLAHAFTPSCSPDPEAGRNFDGDQFFSNAGGTPVLTLYGRYVHELSANAANMRAHLKFALRSSHWENGRYIQAKCLYQAFDVVDRYRAVRDRMGLSSHQKADWSYAVTSYLGRYIDADGIVFSVDQRSLTGDLALSFRLVDSLFESLYLVDFASPMSEPEKLVHGLFSDSQAQNLVRLILLERRFADTRKGLWKSSSIKSGVPSMEASAMALRLINELYKARGEVVFYRFLADENRIEGCRLLSNFTSRMFLPRPDREPQNMTSRFCCWNGSACADYPKYPYRRKNDVGGCATGLVATDGSADARSVVQHWAFEAYTDLVGFDDVILSTDRERSHGLGKLISLCRSEFGESLRYHAAPEAH